MLHASRIPSLVFLCALACAPPRAHRFGKLVCGKTYLASAQDENIDTWLARMSAHDRGVILSSAAIAELNAQNSGRISGFSDLARAQRDGIARVSLLQSELIADHYRNAHGAPLALTELRVLDTIHLETPTHQSATQAQWLLCTPLRTSFYRNTAPIDTRFDRNHCSHIESGESVYRIGSAANNMIMIATYNAVGFVAANTVEERPLLNTEVRVFTREQVLRSLFAHLGESYRWAGTGENPDCSGLLASAFQDFGLALPRNSGDQIESGNAEIALDGMSQEARLAALDAAHAQGVVLMGFPGHVMLYLGRNADNVPMVLHALAEYAERCPDERFVAIGRVLVSSVHLGQGTSRRSLLERATRIAIFAENARVDPR